MAPVFFASFSTKGAVSFQFNRQITVPPQQKISTNFRIRTAPACQTRCNGNKTMCSLATFQPPPGPGYSTICEKNGELVAAKGSPNQLDTYSQVLDTRSSCPKESARSAFLEHNDSLRQKLLRAWYEHGVTGVLEEISSMDEKEEVASWLTALSRHILGAVRWGNALHGSLFPHLSMSREQLVEEFSLNLDWRESIVRCFAWHPHTSKYAVALKDDSVRVVTGRQADVVPILKHKLQKSVADLAWRPLSASVLAVACHSCVLVWHVDPTSLATRPSTSSVQILSQPGHSPVTSLAWCPQGGVLVSASTTDTAMMVWNVALETCVPLRRVGGGGVSLLQWAPDGSKLFSACPARVFRVWESRQWTCEKWTHLATRCQCACWSPDGSVLLFATVDEQTIYSLSFSRALHEQQPGSSIGGSRVAVASVDVSGAEVDGEAGSVKVGGAIQDMVWDPTGSRLAVLFKNSHLIALFQTRLEPMLEIIPCGFVQGEDDAVPHLISFQPNYKPGAQLTVVWSTGKITAVPLHFISDDAIPAPGQLDRQATVNGGHLSSPTLYGDYHH